LNLTKEKEMADFRKWLLVLAVMVLVAIPASAQSCTLAPANPTNIRDGGLTELVGDMVLSCNNPTVQPIISNVQIYMQGAVVSNRLKAGVTGPGGTPICPYAGLGSCVTDALLLTNDVIAGNPPVNQAGTPSGTYGPIVGLLQPAVSGADAPTNRNSILFPGVVLPASTTTTLRITNVRIVAPAINTVVLGLPTQVIESVSFLPAVTVQPSFEVVANVLPAMQYTTVACSGSNYPNFKQCISENAGLANSSSSSGSLHFFPKFTEGFPVAFKPRGTTAQTTPGITALTNFTESGLTIAPANFFNGWNGTDPTGYADNGTRLQVNFKNVPQGITVFVTQREIDTTTITTQGMIATGVDSSLFVSGTGSCSGFEGGAGIPLMKLNANNAAVWEIRAQGTIAQVRQVSFGALIAYVANTTAQLPALTGATPMTTTGQLAPISAVAQASTTDAIPRFRDVQYGSAAVNITSCATTLLYPFTTNKGGFETGIAVINTSLDNYNSTKLPLQTATQTGNCLVYFFDGTTSAPAPVDTGTIVPGGMYVNTISGLAKGAAFQGYVIAKCNFQFGHGYAYIADTSSTKLGAQGYLALVIPDYGVSRLPQDFTKTAGQMGEQLAF